MKTVRLLALALAAILFSSAPGFAATIRGIWEFSNPAALGAGQTLPGGGASPTLIVEGTAPTHLASLGDGTTSLNGVITTVVGPANRLRLTHGILPNGGSASHVRQYSLLFDVFSPAASRDAWRCFFQTTPGNNNDGDYFIRPDNNQMGTAELGYTTAELDEAHWARVVIVVDLPSVRVYVNGALFHTHANQALDGRYALESELLLFADENGENAALHISAVAMWDGALTGSEVAALSGPGGANIGYNGLPPEIVVEQPAGTELGTGGVLVWGSTIYGGTPAGAQMGVTAIAAGGYHTVALKFNGSVLAWGLNDQGQTTVPSGAQTGVTAIAAGERHTVALKSDGSVLTWGSNFYGQTTLPAGAQSGVIAIAAGFAHTLALKSNGSVIAWGYGFYGQTTVPAGAQSGVTAIAGGGGHSVALKSDGSLVAWGRNDDGQTTVPAGAQTGVTAIAAGERHTVALKSDGSVLAWGLNNFGQTTVPTGAQSGVVAIAAGQFHTVALKSDGSVLAWGSNGFGQTTVPAAAQTGVRAISAGYWQTVALDSSGSTVTFTSQELGNSSAPKTFVVKNTGTGALALSGVSVTGGQAGDFAVNTPGMLASVPAGGQTTFSVTFTPSALGIRATTLRIVNDDPNENPLDIALTGTGVVAPEIVVEQPAGTALAAGVVAWGLNANGQTTVPAGAQSGVTAIAGGNAHTMALKSDGSVLAWGYNANGQTTVPAGAQSGVTAIAGGGGHSVALTSDGSVLAWGRNDDGQTTVPAGAQSGVTAIAAGEFHTVALKSDGSVVAWGNNANGQTTVPAGAQSGVVAIAAGESHTVALKSDGSVLAWGLNNYGQTTVPTGAQSGVVAIAAGHYHALALKSNGSVLAWGYNANGQATVPAGAQSGVTAIAGGLDHSVALKSDGSVVAWGIDAYGQTTVPAGAQTRVTAIAAGLYHTVALVAPTVAFASQALGSPSAAKSFVVRNTGTAALALTSVSLTGGQAGDFNVNTTGMLASVPAGGQTTFSVTFTPSALGTRATTLRIVNDDANENPFDIALLGTGQGVFPAWATANGVANDPQVLGANGLTNLLNFAFAIHPVTGGPGPLRYAGTLAGGGTIAATGQPTTVIEPGDTRALFVRRKDRVAAGLTYTPQFSSALLTWQDSAAVPVVLADDGVNQIVSVPYPALGPGETATFFRVVVNLAP